MAEKTINSANPARKKFWNLKRKENMNGYLFVLPWILGAALFFVFPIYRSLEMSFSNITNYTDYAVEWAGLEHYAHALTGDAGYIERYFQSVTSLIETVPFINVFSLIIAVMLNRKFKGRAVFRAIFFLPVVLGSGFAMYSLMNQGVNAEAMEAAKEVLIPREVAIYLGAELTEAVSTFLDLISNILWKSGVPIVIYLAGLQGVPSTLYEAARVDAASEWEMFWLITLPMITPMMLLNFVFTVIDSFSDSRNWMLRYINITSFDSEIPQYEYSAAMAWLFFVFIIILVAIIFLVMRPFVNKVKDN
ncbi:MAG: sugar ABC transporter permease [Ruminococcaceae bacterium]|nr:sugar ABC transporter permease [Oscillospiraceae bacterium]